MTTRRERAKEPIQQLNKQLIVKEEAIKFRKERSRKNLHTADIYIDIAKLVLGGVVIGNLFAETKYSYYIVVAGFLLFLFVVRFIKDFFKPSKHLANGSITNSLEINKKILYQSLAVFVLALAVMIFAGILEEYISVPFGNLITYLF